MQYSPKKLLPHKDRMVLIDEVVDFSFEKRTLSARTTIREDNIFYDDKIKGVSSLLGIELMAQAIGCFAQLSKKYDKPKIGLLLGARMYNNLFYTFKTGETYTIKVREEYTDSDISSFSCMIYNRDNEVASATLTAYQSDDIEQKVGIEVG